MGTIINAPKKLLRLSAVLERVGYRRSRLYSLIQAGLFPAPRKLPGGRAAAWLESDIDAWVESVANGQGGAQ